MRRVYHRMNYAGGGWKLPMASEGWGVANGLRGVAQEWQVIERRGFGVSNCLRGVAQQILMALASSCNVGCLQLLMAPDGSCQFLLVAPCDCLRLVVLLAAPEAALGASWLLLSAPCWLLSGLARS